MKYFELTLRTFLILLVIVFTLQHAQQVPIKHIIILYVMCAVVTVINMVLFKLLGLTEG